MPIRRDLSAYESTNGNPLPSSLVNYNWGEGFKIMGIKMASFVGLLIAIVVGSLIQAPFLWLAGRWIVGGRKALFWEAVWIGVLGAVINVLVRTVAGGAIGSLVQLIAYLYLVKTYFDTGWLNAIIIAIIATVLMWGLLILLGFIGLSFLLI
jgi:hypothetical protein